MMVDEAAEELMLMDRRKEEAKEKALEMPKLLLWTKPLLTLLLIKLLTLMSLTLLFELLIFVLFLVCPCFWAGSCPCFGEFSLKQFLLFFFS